MLDAMFFSSIKSRYSDQLRLIFTGGAPLRKETNAFIKHYLDTKLIHVYASTEVVAISLAIYDQFDAEFTVRFALFQISTLCFIRSIIIN